MSLDAHIVYECKVTLFIHYTHKWELIITCHIGIMSSPLMLALFACRVLVILTVGISVTCLNTHKTCCLCACLRVMVCSRGFLDGHFADNDSILCVRIYALLVCSYCFGILFLHGRRRCPVWTLVRIRELMSVNSRMRMSVPMGAVPYFRENREFVSCWFRV